MQSRIGLLFLIAVASVSAQSVVIDSFTHGGELHASGLAPGSTSQVEWASSLSGPWTNWSGALELDQIEVGTNGSISVKVPVFYRVKGLPPAPPAPSGMVAIPAGTNAGTDPDFGAYSLTVSAFYMDKYEVTKDQWDTVRTWGASNGYTDLVAGAGKAGTHPVQTVNWYNVVKWCNARSEMAGLTPAYYSDAGLSSVFRTGTVSGVDPPYVDGSATGYRLPTDEEWEYAARGGAVSKRFPWGDSDNISHARANYRALGGYTYDDSDGADYHPTYKDATFPYTSPVGDFAANGYGLYDMAGNVWEWCYSWYPGQEGSFRVGRGGRWNDYANKGGVAFRNFNAPGFMNYSIGFRAVLPPGP